jgi:HAD superfamily hydrolase (TIGR01509 family)
MSKYKCIIFDCDGVLVDSEPISNQILADMANNLGANIDLDYAMKNFKGSHFKECMSLISTLVTKPIPDSFESDYRTKSLDTFKKEMKPIKGIHNVINKLDIPFCVASSGPENKIRLNLEITDLLPYFEGKIFSCYAIQKWKPDPSIFLLAAKTMGFNVKDCLVIEDSKLGVLAAKNGGFDVFGYTEHDYNNELEPLCNKTFNNMSQLLNLL